MTIYFEFLYFYNTKGRIRVKRRKSANLFLQVRGDSGRKWENTQGSYSIQTFSAIRKCLRHGAEGKKRSIIIN